MKLSVSFQVDDASLTRIRSISIILHRKTNLAGCESITRNELMFLHFRTKAHGDVRSNWDGKCRSAPVGKKWGSKSLDDQKIENQWHVFRKSYRLVLSAIYPPTQVEYGKVGIAEENAHTYTQQKSLMNTILKWWNTHTDWIVQRGCANIENSHTHFDQIIFLNRWHILSTYIVLVDQTRFLNR